MKRERNTILVYLTYLSVLFCRDTKLWRRDICFSHWLLWRRKCGQSWICEIWRSYKSPFSPFQEFKTFLKYNFSRAHELLRTNSRGKNRSRVCALYHSRERGRKSAASRVFGQDSDFSRMHRSHRASTMRTR